jgi:chromosome segregation ATPase
VGINELEGAVLMDADEYLKISHEVKALKTAMLKLKRELQTDLQAGGHAADSGLTPSAGKTPRRTGSGSQTNELSARIDQLTAEKAKVQEEAEKHKKELQRLSEQLHRSNSDLKRVEEEKSSLSERLQQMESHRDLLLDKVERLHADKHKLEDRLSSLEKSQFYEESWVEEGGVEWEESLMLGGVKGEKTESDTGENSEPESSAVCSGPNS